MSTDIAAKTAQLKIIQLTNKNLSQWLCQLIELEALSNPSPWQASHFNSSIKAGHHCLAMLFNGQVVAYAIAMLGVAEAHLLNIAVLPTVRRQGLAKALLQHLISWSIWHGCQQLFLEVRLSNVAAIGLYQKLGFTTIGHRKNYYQSKHGGREDAKVMVLELSKYHLTSAAL